MKVLIDGLSYFANEGELGEYTRNLINSIHPLSGDRMTLIKDKEIASLNPNESGLKEQVLTINRRALDYKIIGQYIKENEYGIYHCTNNGFSLMKNNPYECKVLATVHTVIPREYEMFYNPKFIVRNYYAMESLDKVTDKILCPSTFIKKYLQGAMTIDEKKIQVVVPRLHKKPHKIDKLVSKAHGKSKFNLSEDYLLYDGDLHRRKRLREFLQVFKEICKGQKTLKVVILSSITQGNYEEYISLKNYTEKLGLSEKVYFLMDLNKYHKIHLYNGAKAIFDFSAYEGFNLSLLQGKELGITTLCSDIESFREILGDYGFYVDINLPFAHRIIADYIEEQDFYLEELEESREIPKEIYGVYEEMEAN